MKVTSLIILSIAICSTYTGDCTYTYVDPNTNWPNAVCTTSTNVCNTTVSKSQSPINVERTKVSYPSSTTDTEIKVEYDKKSGLKIKNVGLTQKVLITDGKITLNNIEYKIAQWHWHQPSEHTFDGLHYDSELHFVHTTTNTAATNPYLVIAVYFQIGDENEWLKKNKYSSGSQTTDGTVDMDKVNPYDIIKPAAKEGVYEYTGGFTTPPCTEGVTFLLTRVPQTMSMAQWTAFAASVPNVSFSYTAGTGNIRPVQSINTRTVYYKYYDFDNKDSGLSAGAIAGIVIGCICGVALIAAIAYFLCCKGKGDKYKDKNFVPFNTIILMKLFI